METRPGDAEGRAAELRKPLTHHRRNEFGQVRVSYTGDDLAAHYSCLADDSAQAGSKRQAAMLFAAAESQLADLGQSDHEEVVRSAGDALAAARTAGDGQMLADCARLAVKAHCHQASCLRYEMGTEGSPLVKDSLTKARALAEDQLAAFRQAGAGPRAEGAMLLSVAEVLLEARSPEERREGLAPAREAQALLEQAGDKKLEATAWLVLGGLHAEARERAKAKAAAERALELTQAAGDRLGEAWALHAVGMVRAMEEAYAECTAALDLIEEAADLFGELGCLRLKGFEMITAAQMCVQLDRPKAAVMAAKEALLALKKAGFGRGSEAVAIGTHVQTLVEQDQPNQALLVAKEGVAKFQKIQDRRQELVMQDVLARVYLEKDETDDAMQAAQAGLKLCQELQDAELEAELLLTVSEACLKQGQLDDALHHAQDSSTILRACDDMWKHTAVAQYQVAYIRALQGDFAKATTEAYLCKDFFFKADEPVGEGLAMLQVAGIQAAEGDTSGAIKTAQQGGDIFDSVPTQTWAGFAFYVQAEILRLAGDFESALEMAEQRLKIARDLGYRKEEAKAMHTITSIHLGNKDAAKATISAREGLRVARAVGDRIVEVHILLQLIQANINLINDAGGYDKSTKLGEETVKLSREAVAVARKVYHGKLRPYALYWNAQVLNMSPFAVEAIEVADETLRLFQVAGDKLGEAHALLLQAQVMYVRKKPDKAKAIADQALAMFQELEDDRGMSLVKGVLDRVAPRSRPAAAPDGGAMSAPIAAPAALPAESAAVPEETEKGLDPAMVREQIIRMAEDIVGEETDIFVDSPLMDMGMDSLSTVSMRNDMARTFRVKLAASVMFDYPTINQLTDLIVEKAGS